MEQRRLNYIRTLYNAPIVSLFSSIVVLFSIAIASILAIQLPLYTDDVCYHILSTRFWQDGFLRTSQFVNCPNAGMGLDIPYVLRPALILNSTIFGWISSPQQLRVVSLIIFIAWLACIYMIRKEIFPKESTLSKAMILMLPLSGSIPLALSMGRPETSIVTILILQFVLYKVLKNKKLLIVSFYFLPSWMLLLHPKSIYFLPLFAFFYFTIFKRKQIRLAIYTLWLVVLSFYSYVHYKVLFSCAEDSHIDNMIKGFNLSLDPGKILHAPWNFIESSARSVERNTAMYFKGNLLMNGNWTGLQRIVNQDILRLSDILLLPLLIIFLSNLASIYRFLTERRSRDIINAYTFIMLLVFLWHSFTHRLYSFYYAGYFLILFISAFTFTFKPIDPSRKYFKTYLLSFGGNAIVTFLLFLLLLCDGKLLNIGEKWQDKSFYVSTSMFTKPYAEIPQSSEIKNLLMKCNKDINMNSRLVVDEATYFALKNYPLPIMTQYLWEHFQEGEPSLDEILNDGKFDALIAACRRVPSKLRDKFMNSGDYCCVSLKDRAKHFEL